MKTYDEMADEVFRQGDEIIKERKIRRKKTAAVCCTAAICLCLCAAAGLRINSSKSTDVVSQADVKSGNKNSNSFFDIFKKESAQAAAKDEIQSAASQAEEEFEYKKSESAAEADDVNSFAVDHGLEEPTTVPTADERSADGIIFPAYGKNENGTAEKKSASGEPNGISSGRTVVKTTAAGEINNRVDTTVAYTSSANGVYEAYPAATQKSKGETTTVKQKNLPNTAAIIEGDTTIDIFSVKKVNGTLLTLEDRNGQLYMCDYGELSGIDLRKFNYGDVVTVRYKSELAETYPYQMTVLEIYPAVWN